MNQQGLRDAWAKLKEVTSDCPYCESEWPEHALGDYCPYKAMEAALASDQPEQAQWNVEQILTYIWQCMSSGQSAQEYPFERFNKSEMGRRLRTELTALAQPVTAKYVRLDDEQLGQEPQSAEAQPSEPLTVGKAAIQLERDIASAINRVSAENDSNTPDFILAEFLTRCLDAWNRASRAREKWYGKELKIGGAAAPVSSAPSELCGKVVAHLIAGASWYPCALPKGHEGGCRAAGGCLKHGRYLGEEGKPPQCPKWPDCMPGTFLSHISNPVHGWPQFSHRQVGSAILRGCSRRSSKAGITSRLPSRTGGQMSDKWKAYCPKCGRYKGKGNHCPVCVGTSR